LGHTRLRDKLEDGILDSIPNTELNGDKTQRFANTSNITFHGIESEALLILLDKEDICASSGSACLADSAEPSHTCGDRVPAPRPSLWAVRGTLYTVDLDDAPIFAAAVIAHPDIVLSNDFKTFHTKKAKDFWKRYGMQIESLYGLLCVFGRRQRKPHRRIT